MNQKMKNKSLFSIENNIIECEKSFIIIIRKYFSLENFCSLYNFFDFQALGDF